MSKIYSQLQQVQLTLEAPKNNYNEFGNYNYRSAEDILEAVKPLLAENGLILTISDEMVMLGDRYYVKAIVRIQNTEGECIEVSAYAREEETLKGMVSSQITGSTSSYARKYALNGLFCIDDTKDADATNTHDKGNAPNTNKKPTTKPTGPTNKVEEGTSSKLKCSDCTADITQGEKVYSENKFDKPLCRACQNKYK